MTRPTPERIGSAFQVALDRLLGEMNPEGFWEGELSSSALSTATAVSALSVAHVPSDVDVIDRGLSWLAETQNPDGGWGDTDDSPSNPSTTLLTLAAFRLAKSDHEPAIRQAQAYIAEQVGTGASDIASAMGRIYGADRTFAVPILMNCALAGMVPWDEIPALPFELAALPGGLYAMLKLHVVSYALPALIAIGLTIDRNRPTRPRVRRAIRRAVTKQVLAKLEQIQPENGGFLEATPLTSFVAMSLGSVYGAKHPVVSKCLDFIRRSQRDDGSWPIDTNLSVWLTTGTVQALSQSCRLGEIDEAETRRWIAERQYRSTHPFTGAAPGGFSWTHLPGGVPDADDTSGAVLACVKLGEHEAARAGARWLLDLQNADGGWPAFCRGWGQLPFDRSSPDITAHALRALQAVDPDGRDHRSQRAVDRGFKYLADVQRPDGSWIPLWFGNQSVDDRSNPVFGTSRSLLAYADHLAATSREVRQPVVSGHPCPETVRINGCIGVLAPDAPSLSKQSCTHTSLGTGVSRNREAGVAEPHESGTSAEARNGVRYLLGAQNENGGWGGGPGASSSVEETALSLTALAEYRGTEGTDSAVARGLEYLVARVEDGSWIDPTPIGLYFSSLWYSERLYPLIWTVEALGNAEFGMRNERSSGV